MSNVIGPISEEHWWTMNAAKASIRWMLPRNGAGNFDKAINRNKAIYNEYIQYYTTRCAA